EAAIPEIVHYFAGPAVQYYAFHDEVSYEGCVDCVAACIESGDEEKSRDFTEPRFLARVSTTSSRWACTPLQRVATWTDELARIPRVWSTITALADQLPHGVTLAGSDAADVMEAAFGQVDR